MAPYRTTSVPSLATFTSKSDEDKSKSTKTFDAVKEGAPLSTMASHENERENSQRETNHVDSWLDESLLPSKFVLLNEPRKRALLEKPVGTLSASELQELRKEYQHGAKLAIFEQATAGLRDTYEPRGGPSPGRKRMSTFQKRKRLMEEEEELNMDWSYATNLVKEGWILLDRIVAEMEQNPTRDNDQTNNQVDNSHESNENKELLPWALQTWRLIHLYENPGNDAFMNRLPCVQEIYPRLRKCLDQHLFVWSSHLVNFLLDVVDGKASLEDSKRSRQSAAYLGQEIFDAMVGVSPNSPESPLFLPDRELVSKLISLWHKSRDADAPHRAMSLLATLFKAHQEFPRLDKYTPDSHVFVGVIKCWAERPEVTFRDLNGTSSRQDLIWADEQTNQIAGSVALRLYTEAKRYFRVQDSFFLYDAVLKCQTRSYDPQNLRAAQALFNQRIQDWKDALRDYREARTMQNKRRLKDLRLDSSSYLPLLHLYTNTGQTHQAVALLKRMEGLAHASGQSFLLPRGECYRVVQKTLTRKMQAHGSQHRHPFLQWTPRAPAGSHIWVEEAVYTRSRIKDDLVEILESKDEDPAEVVRDAFALFDNIASASFRYPNDIPPDFLPWPSHVLDLAVDAWRRHLHFQRSRKGRVGPSPWGPECRAPYADPQWLLNRLNNYTAVGLFRPGGRSLDHMLELVEKTTQSKGYHTHIYADPLMRFLIKNSGDPATDESFLETSHFRRLLRIWRNAAHFNKEAYRTQQEIKKSEKAINKLKEWYNATGLEKFRPDAEMYAYLVEIYIESLSQTKPNIVAERAITIFEEWKALGTEKDEPPLSVEKLYLAVVRARSYSSNGEETLSLIDDIILKCREGQRHFTDPSSILLCLVEALGRSGKPEMVEKTISEIDALHIELGDKRLRPSTKFYNALISAYGKAGELMKVEEVFHRLLMPKVVDLDGHEPALFPDLDSWKSVLAAWASSESEEAASRAVQLLRQLSSSANLSPDTTAFNLVLECFLKTTKMEEQVVLDEALSLVKTMETESNLPKPNKQTYLNLMKLLNGCGKPDESVEVLKRFCELCERGVIVEQPDIRHFNTAICAYSDLRGDPAREAFAKAFSVLQMMMEASYIFYKTSAGSEPFFAEPNRETYRNLLEIALDESKSDSDRMAHSEMVLEAMVQQKWHEVQEHTGFALEIFHDIMDHWTTMDTEDSKKRIDMLNDLILSLEENTGAGTV